LPSSAEGWAHAPLRLRPRAQGAATNAREQTKLNPGNGWVSRLCHDPRVAVAVPHQMMVRVGQRNRTQPLVETRMSEAMR
jgi:hypothetical protein